MVVITYNNPFNQALAKVGFIFSGELECWTGDSCHGKGISFCWTGFPMGNCCFNWTLNEIFTRGMAFLINVAGIVLLGL